MVENASGIAHTGTCHNQARAWTVVNLLRLVSRCCSFQSFEILANRLFPNILQQPLIKQLRVILEVLEIKLRRFDRHGAVEKEWKRLLILSAEHPAHENCQH